MNNIHTSVSQQETDSLLLGTRVAIALNAENEPYDRTGRRNGYKSYRVPRQYATVRVRAYQAGKGKVRL